MKRISILIWLFIVIPFFWSMPVRAEIGTPPSVEYVLPYPGILPTHPLYLVKKIRDSILEMLIVDPLRKAEFYILQADKKLSMTVSLAEGKKPKEAAEVFSQSLSARKEALTLLEAYRTSGGALPGHLKEKFLLSMEKHEEIARDVQMSTDGIVALRAKANEQFGGVRE